MDQSAHHFGTGAAPGSLGGSTVLPYWPYLSRTTCMAAEQLKRKLKAQRPELRMDCHSATRVQQKRLLHSGAKEHHGMSLVAVPAPTNHPQGYIAKQCMLGGTVTSKQQCTSYTCKRIIV